MKSYWFFSISMMVALAGCGDSLDSGGANCGDGTQDLGEECDDGNLTAGDGCDASCDLESTCGDETVEGLEQCDDGEAGSAICGAPTESTPCQFKTTAFKITKFACPDPSPTATGGLAGICPLAANAFVADGGGVAAEIADGSIDLNLMLLMDPLDQAVPGSRSMRFTAADCAYTGPPTDAVATSCSLDETNPVVEGFVVTNQTDGICLERDMDNYHPGIGLSEAPPVEAGDFGCFKTQPVDFAITLGSIRLPFSDAEIAMQYNAEPTTGLLNGLLKGFMTGEDAATVVIPVFGLEIQLTGLLAQDPSCALLPDGQDPTLGCDIGPDGVTLGWWVHILLEAEAVTWNGGPLCGNGVLDTGEVCDPGIASGAGECPVKSIEDCEADENPQDMCTETRLINGNPCDPACAHVPYTGFNPPPAPLTPADCGL